jgi:hypothetical protein
MKLMYGSAGSDRAHIIGAWVSDEVLLLLSVWIYPRVESRDK